MEGAPVSLWSQAQLLRSQRVQLNALAAKLSSKKMERLAGGVINSVLALDEKRVLRLGNPHPLWAHSGSVTREVQRMKSYAAVGVPVPRILEFDDDELYMVMERIPGCSLEDALSSNPVLDKRKIFAALLKVWAEPELRLVPDEAGFGGPYSRTDGPCVPVCQTFEEYLSALGRWGVRWGRDTFELEMEPLNQFCAEKLHEELAALPGIDFMVLSHVDLHVGNIMVTSAEDPSITGILDFESCKVTSQYHRWLIWFDLAKEFECEDLFLSSPAFPGFVGVAYLERFRLVFDTIMSGVYSAFFNISWYVTSDAELEALTEAKCKQLENSDAVKNRSDMMEALGQL
jgi:aminoglycoside phosphotransferase (APT) family kinase protein